MNDGLFVIISKVPERISRYTLSLRELTSEFLFFSDIESFVSTRNYVDLSLIIVDNIDDDQDLLGKIRFLRNKDIFDTATILIIVRDGDNHSGVVAMNAGAEDYLPFSRVNSELATRVRMHLSTEKEKKLSVDNEIEIDCIYPLEDRITIRNALWHMENNLSLIKRVGDLAFYVGLAERDLNKAFVFHFDKTAFEYLRAFRINKAKELLFKTRFSVTQIAGEVGYSSAANFSTAFKSVTGLSPREYRSQALLIV